VHKLTVSWTVVASRMVGVPRRAMLESATMAVSYLVHRPLKDIHVPCATGLAKAADRK